MRHPRHICLVRGNHECRSVSGHFGFKEECVRKYGLPVYYRFLLCFQTMPLGALVRTDYDRDVDVRAGHGHVEAPLPLLLLRAAAAAEGGIAHRAERASSAVSEVEF